ncbi:chromate transporter [Herminiimonas fonticola]|uniref:Chromate transporter n=1 Tax=Herminiimonas fonticola TaxID=303380 RepID=A0A4R6GF81_9BURK|nr:chromate transporter [Herminiimonas fonticola]RBA24424.1 Chromate transport protein ChrA [Herminiimonas fonticola]TDN93541.1 chromate transporter [Herminiimonas fonticola]
MNTPSNKYSSSQNGPNPDEPDFYKARPQSLKDLFLSFSLLALQGFGGVMAIVQQELVEKKKWLTREEFIEDWAVAQIMPGPNVVNLSIIIGGRYFGWRGALAALAGMLCLPLLLVLAISILYAPYAHHPQVTNALRAMGAVAAGLILATGFRLIAAMKNNPLGPRTCFVLGALCFIAVALLRIPLIYPLFGLGVIACVLAYRKIAR